MNAFFSGTDDADDRGSCYFSGVVGKLTTNPEMVFRFNVAGSRNKIEKITFQDMFEEHVEVPEIPKEWLGQVKREVYTAPVSNFRGGYQGGYGGGYDDVYGSQYSRTHGGGRSGGSGSQGTGRSAGAHSKGGSVDNLSDDELLGRLGYPFVPDSEGQNGPFSGRSRSRGAKKQKATTKAGGKGSKQKVKVSSLPTRPRKPRVQS